MELRQLKYFKEACERQNFSEAARILHISQSTLSQQIKQLEEELDVLLFDRIGKRIVPTEAGQAFLPYAARAIYDAEDGKQIIRDLKGIETGVLHIGVTYSMSPLLIAALQLFNRAYPKIVRFSPRFFYFPLFLCSLHTLKSCFLLQLNLPYYIPLLPSIISDRCRLDYYISILPKMV